MANKYSDILALTTGKNTMGLSNSIKRDYGIPLDYTSVQKDYEAAVIYAAENAKAYVGQPISVGDTLYIITEASQGRYPVEVEEGGKQYDVYLKEVGSATEGDGKTITLKDGVLSLYGVDAEGLTNGTYVPSLVNGVLTWAAPDTSTAEGQQQAIDALGLRTTALETTVNGKAAVGEEGAEGYEPAVKGLVTSVAENTANIAAILDDIAAEAKARDDADKVINNKIGSVAEGTTVVEMIFAVEDQIPTVPTNVSEFNNDAGYLTEHQDISGKADKATTLAGYGIEDAYTKDEVNSAISAMTHLSTKIVETAPTVETAEAGIIYLVADEKAAGTYIEYILVEDGEIKSVEQIGSTATDLADYVTFDALTTTLVPYAKTAEVVTNDEFTAFEAINTEAINAAKQAGDDALGALNTYKGEVTTALAGKADNAALANYYTKTEADALLDDKADAESTTTALASKIETAQITHTTTGTTEGVTKEGTALKIVIDAYTKEQVYTKSETDNQIDAKIASVTGGESAADVKLALESYRDALNEEIWGAEAKSWTTSTTVDGKTVVAYNPQYGNTSRVDALESLVGTAASGEATATGLFAKVDAAQASADAAVGAVATLENGQVRLNKDQIAALTTVVNGTSNEDTSSLFYRVGALETANTAHAGEFATLKAKVDTAVDTTIPGLSSRIGINESAITAIDVTLNGTPASGEEGTDTYIPATEGIVTTIDKKANAADVYTKSEVDAKVITSGEVAYTTEGKPAGVVIANNKITVTVDSYTKGEVDSLLANLDQSALEAGITANASNLAILVGDDKDADGKATKSIRAIAKEEVAAVVGTAPDALDTLEEIATWINNDESGAAAMSAAIADHSAVLKGIGGESEPATVTAAIAAAKQEAIEVASFTLEVATTEKLGGIKSAVGENKVTVAEDGTASVASVNVNSLTQTEGDELILFGGSAN